MYIAEKHPEVFSKAGGVSSSFWWNQQALVKNADKTWAARWEERSHKRGKPEQVIGWKAGETGSLLTPPDYQKLEGDFVNGVDPAEKA